MVVILISWCLLGAGVIALGLALLQALGADRAIGDPGDRIAIAAWLGLGAAAALSLAAGLFAPVTPWTLLAAALASAATLARRGQVTAFRLSPFQAVCCGALLLSLACSSAVVEVDAYDTALYHQQAVSWLSQFGVVKGLAWLHFRLGWSSSWFALGAALNHGILAGRVSPI